MRRLTLVVLVFLILFPFTGGRPAQAAGVVGDGTTASCTRDALNAALSGGGTVTFNCGGNVTIPITTTLNIGAGTYEIDGGGTVTLQGVSGQRIIDQVTFGFNATSTLTLRNLTINGASRTGSEEEANGAAIRSRSQSANFNTEFPTLIIENVTFTNNVSTQTSSTGNPYDYGGGAIFTLGGVLSVSNSTFVGNRSNGGAGGAIHGLGSNITITNSNFSENVSTAVSSTNSVSGYGGAIYVDGAKFSGGGGITITGSRFTNNSAANQGGFAYINLYTNRNDFLTIDSSAFIGNTVSGGGMGLGGALSGGGTDNGSGSVSVTITNSLFSGNSVAGGTSGGSGGAIAIAQLANTRIANSTFTGNRALGLCSNCVNANGGAIYIVNNPVPYEVINNTIVGNTADWVGGGITASTSGVLRNNIIANNTANNGGNPWNIQQNCGMTASTGGNNIQFPALNSFDPNDRLCSPGTTIVNPQVNALANNGGITQTIALETGSPAIDAGDNSAAIGISTDQRGVGFPRIINGTVDIGAFEAPSIPLPQASVTSVIRAGASPTNAGNVAFTVTFSTNVSGITTGNFAISATGVSGASVSGVSGSGATYVVNVNTGTGSGTIRLDVANDAGLDVDLTNVPFQSGETYTIDKTGPTVTINQASGQIDPTEIQPLVFDVVFNETVSDFATGDVILSGTAGATTAVVSGSGTTYTVSVTGMTSGGTVVAGIPAGVASDPLGNTNSASTSTDNTITYTVPGIPLVTVFATDSTTTEDGDPGTFRIERTGDTNAALTVNYTLSGTSTDADYTPVLVGTTEIDIGATFVDLSITPIDDADVEGTHTVILTLSDAVTYDLGESSQATITISDNDGAGLPVVTVTATDAGGDESGSNAINFRFDRTGDATGALDVAFTVMGTATNGTDYTPTLTSPLNIPANAAFLDVALTPIDDGASENSETIVINVIVIGTYTVGANGSATATIADNDSGTDSGSDSDTTTAPSLPTPPACALITGGTNGIIRADVPAGLNANVFCRIIVENSTYRQNAAEIGDQTLVEAGVLQAVDVFGFTSGGLQVATFNQPVRVCLQGSGRMFFRDATAAPRVTVPLVTTFDGAFTCTSIPNAGTIVLVR
jgi:hypothetical protein